MVAFPIKYCRNAAVNVKESGSVILKSQLTCANGLWHILMMNLERSMRRGWDYIHDVIKWKHFLCCWPLVWGIYRSPMNSPHKGQWRGALMFSFICNWINIWVNNLEAGGLRHHRAHYDMSVMIYGICQHTFSVWKGTKNYWKNIVVIECKYIYTQKKSGPYITPRN